MNELINELKILSERYEVWSKNLGLDDDEEEFYPDSDAAINDGMSQAYWHVHRELEELIKKYS